MKQATLLLQDGTQLTGQAFGSEGTALGELVFNTGMTGYQEILTDPSYAGQAVVLTYPLIGSYGVHKLDVQSKKIQAAGLIVSEAISTPSHWEMISSLSAYLQSQNIFGLAGVDTRMLTRKIRNGGVMPCVMTTEPISGKHHQLLKDYKFPTDVIHQASTEKIEVLPAVGETLHRIGLMDLGVKTGILRNLAKRGFEVTVFPSTATADQILSANLEAILLSNGPGDPADVPDVAATVKQLFGKLPIFGICMGLQVLALALGGTTYKLSFGHRGSNHPVLDTRNRRVLITAQNHGFAVKAESLPDTIQVTHINLNDNTVAGFYCPELNIRAVQFHPEAGPGPQEGADLFDEWLRILKSSSSERKQAYA